MHALAELVLRFDCLFTLELHFCELLVDDIDVLVEVLVDELEDVGEGLNTVTNVVF